jgi:exosortase
LCIIFSRGEEIGQGLVCRRADETARLFYHFFISRYDRYGQVIAMTNPATAWPSESLPPVFPSEGRRSRLISGPLPVCILFLLWGYVVYRLGTLWHSNENYAYGWFVPFLCVCLFWERWQRRPARSPVRPAGGTFFLLVMFGLVLLPAALFLEIIPNWRFAGWIFAGAAVGITFIVLYFLGGRSWSRYFAFPVIFFLIAVPWPTRFEQPVIDKMSKLNAAVSAASANVLGSPAVRRGVLIETGPGLVGVDDACSGIRSFQASVMVALFLGELFTFNFVRRGALLFGAVVLAFSCNVVRTTYLVRIADLHGLAAVNLHHDQAGFTILGITLVGLLILTWLLRPKQNNRADEIAVLATENPATQNVQPAATQTGVSKLAKPTIIKAALTGLVVWIVLIELGIYFWFHPAEQKAANVAGWSLKLPDQAAEYHETAISENVQTMLSYDEGHQAEWRDKSGCAWQLYYFRWLPTDSRYRAIVTCGSARGHAPDVCLLNQGMLLQTNFGTQTVNINGVKLQVDTERFLDQGRNFHVFSCYWEPNYQDEAQAAPGTIMAIRAVFHALETKDRGRNEKRVLKVGVWGEESDEAAQAAFNSYLPTMITK